MNGHIWQNARVVERFHRTTLPHGECVAWAGEMRHSACAAYPKIIVTRGGKRRPYRAHVLGWEIANQRDWPEGMIARHSCDNPWCVNPSHILPGTKADNTRDMIERGRHGYLRRDRCKHGHPFVGDNLRLEGGWRRCRECIRTKSRKYYHRKKAAEGVAA